MARDILLIGSIPLSPAQKVFETVARCLGPSISRIPDGEQIGWSSAARRSLQYHPDFEPAGTVALNAQARDPKPLFRLKAGRDPSKVKLGPFGYADNAKRSYAAFAELKKAGVIPPATKYQITMPGPGTSTWFVQLPADILLPMAREALLREIEDITANIPTSEIAIQIDVAMEAEHEEYLRRPEAFDQPVHKAFHWTLDQMSRSVAWLADRIPGEVELGIHVCSIWHHDPAAGQDNAAIADITNAIVQKIGRKIAYVHVPLIPAHDENDIGKLKALQLPGDTMLYLGLINLADGVEGARMRVAIAKRLLGAFGVSSFCGLGRPPTTVAQGPSMHSHPPVPELRRATPDTIEMVLELHKAVAAL